ncbi:DinB family protein [Marinigracilibium pacificum]|uniref:Damage-inducible protein DinB n=1 Tax=Marinigracilibium pacificum TaxID=2729599 RepID=A0A848ITV4_9BACT|nr:DinB family protein [Marinigracilibium pacificum]NMM47176.1 damage-inducible protein DinB [Marinigracilibium pacificum]
MKKLFEFNHQLNEDVCNHLVSNKVYDGKFRRLLSHIINAQDIWLSRIQNTSSEFEIWQEHDPEDLKKHNDQHLKSFLDLIQNQDLNKVLSYNSLAGKGYTTAIEDILMHIVNHGTHHRAQISQLLSQNNINPIPTDYIYYIRKAKSK